MAHDDDNKGHGPKPVTIVVNGTAHEVPKGDISFEQIVLLAFPDETAPDDKYAVTYEKGDHPNKPDHVLSPGESVKVKEGTIFVVSPTGRS